MRWYYGMIFIFFPFAVFEAARNWTWTVEVIQVFGMILLSFGLGLRLWTLSTLGAAWTMSCLFWPQMPLIRRGPFRFLKHPEYLSRILDTAGLFFAVNAMWSGFAAAVALTLVSLAIIKTEGRDLLLLRPEVYPQDNNETEPLGDRGFVP